MRAEDPVLKAAKKLVDALASDPEFVEQIARDEIDKRIAAGVLIPAERLQVAPGLTLVAVGRVEHLEQLLADIVEQVGETIPQDLRDLAAGLLEPEEATGDDPALPGGDVAQPADEDEPVDGDDGDDGDEEAAEPPAPAEPEGPKMIRRPSLPTEPGVCEECKDDVDVEQMKLSHIKAGRALCRPCMIST